MSAQQVSVIIPTYSHRDYVLTTLESVFTQTFTDYEVIVVNDGSPDDTAKYLRPLVEAGKVKYIEQPNAGQAAARNRGLSVSSGQYVAFLDDDDLWPRDKLEWQVEALDSDKRLAAVGGSAVVVDRHGNSLAPNNSLSDCSRRWISLAELFHGNPFISPGQVLVRRSSLSAVNGFDVNIWGADDLDLWMRLAAEGTIEKRGRCGLYYRQHDANASRDRMRMFFNSMAVIRKNLALVEPSRRPGARKAGFRWVHHYAGSPVLRGVDGGGRRAIGKSVQVLWSLAGSIAKDATLAKNVLRDFLPQPLLQVAEHAKRRFCARTSTGPSVEPGTGK